MTEFVPHDTFYSEQEHFRTSESSNVDDRTEHEIYAYPFLRSVQAGVAAVMCSYSRVSPYVTVKTILTAFHPLDLINETYACSNNKTLNDILKREFGFQGCQ